MSWEEESRYGGKGNIRIRKMEGGGLDKKIVLGGGLELGKAFDKG